MKFVGIVAAAMVAATSATAMDLGNGLSLGGEVETSYTTGVGDYNILFTPEAGFTAGDFAFTVETEIDMLELNNDAVDNFQGLDLEATYSINSHLEAFGEVSTDKDIKFGDVTVGTRLSF